MDLGRAWISLGRDPGEVMDELRAYPTTDERIAAAEKMLQDAERTARVLMGRYHPDANPDDPQASKRFMDVKTAIDTLRVHTEGIRRQNGSSSGTPASPTIFIKVER